MLVPAVSFLFFCPIVLPDVDWSLIKREVVFEPGGSTFREWQPFPEALASRHISPDGCDLSSLDVVLRSASSSDIDGSKSLGRNPKDQGCGSFRRNESSVKESTLVEIREIELDSYRDLGSRVARLVRSLWSSWRMSACSFWAIPIPEVIETLETQESDGLSIRLEYLVLIDPYLHRFEMTSIHLERTLTAASEPKRHLDLSAIPNSVVSSVQVFLDLPATQYVWSRIESYDWSSILIAKSRSLEADHTVVNDRQFRFLVDEMALGFQRDLESIAVEDRALGQNSGSLVSPYQGNEGVQNDLHFAVVESSVVTSESPTVANEKAEASIDSVRSSNYVRALKLTQEAIQAWTIALNDSVSSPAN